MFNKIVKKLPWNNFIQFSGAFFCVVFLRYHRLDDAFVVLQLLVKKIKKVVDNRKWLWYSNLAVAREQGSSRTKFSRLCLICKCTACITEK